MTRAMSLAVVLAWSAAGAWPAAAQGVGPLAPLAAGLGTIVRPQSSLPVPNGGGRVAHTNVEQFVPLDAAPASQVFQPSLAETPASLACIYGQVGRADGCSPLTATAVAGGGSRLIAIVDAYDHPLIADNVSIFSSQFGLPQANLAVVFAAGIRPAQDPTGGWEVEEALDVEMAHALAPAARLVLVEASSSSVRDLVAAVDVASGLVARAGGGEVSMSWGTEDFRGERAYDGHFTMPGVVYFAASGDSAGAVLYPAVSANVVAVGGTTVTRNRTTGAFAGEATWGEGGGGASAHIPSPPFQTAVRDLSGTTRAIPDVAADANPYSGVNVYSSIPGSSLSTGWLVYGGTSAATPIVAALVNAAGTFRASSANQLGVFYAKHGSPAFRSILRGTCGPGASYDPTRPWNPCVGLGSFAAGVSFPDRPNPF